MLAKQMLVKLVKQRKRKRKRKRICIKISYLVIWFDNAARSIVSRQSHATLVAHGWCDPFPSYPLRKQILLSTCCMYAWDLEHFQTCFHYRDHSRMDHAQLETGSVPVPRVKKNTETIKKQTEPIKKKQNKQTNKKIQTNHEELALLNFTLFHITHGHHSCVCACACACAY